MRIRRDSLVLTRCEQAVKEKMKAWFYRFTAAHFFVTALSGVLLYFRPLEGREGWYSEQTKELLVGLHNGELWGRFIFENRYLSGVPIGLALATTLMFFSVRRIKRAGWNRSSRDLKDTPE